MEKQYKTKSELVATNPTTLTVLLNISGLNVLSKIDSVR
jgi:hypothetical protein